MTERPTRRGRTVAWLAARSLRQLVLAAAAVIVLVSGAFGGLRQAEPDARDALVLDEPQVAQPFTITVKGVSWADDLGEVIGPSDFGRYLLVIADVSSTQENSVDGFVVHEALRLKGLEELAGSENDDRPVASEDADPRVIVTEDRVKLSELGPGLTYEVAFIWEQKLSEPLPRTVDLVARVHGFRQSSLDEQENWFDSADGATGRFRVTKFGES
ncbi:MAG: hypothetical protein ABW004_16640 [Aeromicrobium sp.]